VPNNAQRSSLDAQNVGVNESTNQRNAIDNNPIHAIAMLQVCYLPCPDCDLAVLSVPLKGESACIADLEDLLRQRVNPEMLLPSDAHIHATFRVALCQ
jgi:hypothetical protein